MGAPAHVQQAGREVANAREKTKSAAHKPSAIVVFVGAYALFAAARLFVRIDRAWYESLNRPDWVLPMLAQEVVWFAMFGLLALSTVYVFRNAAGTERAHFVFGVRVLHYMALQAFIVLLFYRHDLLLASVDAGILTLLAATAAVLAWRATEKGSKLLASYSIWTLYTFAATSALLLANGR